MSAVIIKRIKNGVSAENAAPPATESALLKTLAFTHVENGVKAPVITATARTTITTSGLSE